MLAWPIVASWIAGNLDASLRARHLFNVTRVFWRAWVDDIFPPPLVSSSESDAGSTEETIMGDAWSSSSSEEGDTPPVYDDTPDELPSREVSLAENLHGLLPVLEEICAATRLLQRERAIAWQILPNLVSQLLKFALEGETEIGRHFAAHSLTEFQERLWAQACPRHVFGEQDVAE